MAEKYNETVEEMEEVEKSEKDDEGERIHGEEGKR